MGDYGPSEAWIRDSAFQDPFALLKAIPCLRERSISSVRRYREFSVPSGRIDLLIVAPGVIVVVEFKADQADESAVAQVLRYTGQFYWQAYDHSGIVVPVVAAARFTAGARSAAFAAGVALIETKPAVAFAADCNAIPDLDDDTQNEIELMFFAPPEPRHELDVQIRPASIIETPLTATPAPSLATGADA